MVILKYGRTNGIYKKKRPKVRCTECGCLMMLDEEDYTVKSQSDVCFNPFKNLKPEELKMEIEYKCAYCESKNTKRSENTVTLHRIAFAFLAFCIVSLTFNTQRVRTVIAHHCI